MWPAVTRFVSSRAIGRNVGLIYTFHYIGDPVIPGLGQDLFLSRRTFSSMLDFLCARMAPLDPLEFLTRLEAGTLPERAVMLTFDDGSRDGYTEALPELERRGLKACFFVCPGLIQQDRTVPCLELMDLCARAPRDTYNLALEVATASATETVRLSFPITAAEESRRAAYRALWPHLLRSLSSHHAALMDDLRSQMNVSGSRPHSYPLAGWDELEQLHRRGHWIANHTMLHSTCRTDPVERFAEDTARANEILHARFPAPRRIFCYPYGEAADVTASSAEALRDMGTEAAFVTQGGAARPARDSMLGLHREDASYSVGAAKLSPLLAMMR